MRRIPLRRRDGTIRAYTQVDDEDYGALSVGGRWCVLIETKNTQYVGRGRGKNRVQMHRLIMGVTDPRAQVDHIDGNGLNNQRHNLRVATNAQNTQNRTRLNTNNTSGVRGVSKRRNGKWQALVGLNGRKHYLGLFARAEEAERAVIAFRAEHMPFSPDANLRTS